MCSRWGEWQGCEGQSSDVEPIVELSKLIVGGRVQVCWNSWSRSRCVFQRTTFDGSGNLTRFSRKVADIPPDQTDARGVLHQNFKLYIIDFASRGSLSKVINSNYDLTYFCGFIVIIYNLGKASRDARSLIYSKKNQGNIINKVLWF